jgi:hypothetical protein
MNEQVIEYNRPPMTSYQLKILDSTKRFLVILASTKSGKTTACAVAFLESALLEGGPGKRWLWASPSHKQAKIAFDKLRYEMVAPGLFTRVNETDLEIELLNGAILTFRSVENVDGIYGFEFWGKVIFDEYTRARPESWQAIRSTITATGAKVIFIGNSKGGMKNWGVQLFEKAKAENDDPNSAYGFLRITAYDAAREGIIELSEIEQAQQDLPEAVFNELFLAEVSEDGSNIFGFKHIDKCIGEQSTKDAVCYGIDLARGRKEGSDHTVVIGLDADGAVCHFQRFQYDWEYQLDKIKMLPKGKKIRIDATGAGDAPAEILAKHFPLLDPFVFTQKSKQQIIEGLAIGIQQGKIKFPDGLIVDELKNLETSFTRSGVSFSAPPGLHDDCVMALALAYSCWNSSRPTGTYCFSFLTPFQEERPRLRFDL